MFLKGVINDYLSVLHFYLYTYFYTCNYTLYMQDNFLTVYSSI